MPDQPQHQIPEEFAGNEWLVDELFEKYQQDRNAVDEKWWPIFEQMQAAESGKRGVDAAAPAAKTSSAKAPAEKASPDRAPQRSSGAAAKASAPAEQPEARTGAGKKETEAPKQAGTREKRSGQKPIPAQLPHSEREEQE